MIQDVSTLGRNRNDKKQVEKKHEGPLRKSIPEKNRKRLGLRNFVIYM
jgi:hypothetical protein